jgi:hypothetical protein
VRSDLVTCLSLSSIEAIKLRNLRLKNKNLKQNPSTCSSYRRPKLLSGYLSYSQVCRKLRQWLGNARGVAAVKFASRFLFFLNLSSSC